MKVNYLKLIGINPIFYMDKRYYRSSMAKGKKDNPLRIHELFLIFIFRAPRIVKSDHEYFKLRHTRTGEHLFFFTAGTVFIRGIL
ncbi:hypothetical protein BZK42_26170 [Citrobacter braakii]|uniref:Uncharacterized protein n=1 Tax=Citrobacter braakii TaxID=57706 RepID=A0A1V8NS02_CITBR|nr:hypothetical protein BZK42_26170 [Citrobacter braakii]